MSPDIIYLFNSLSRAEFIYNWVGLLIVLN